jgi:hypothetical protein
MKDTDKSFKLLIKKLQTLGKKTVRAGILNTSETNADGELIATYAIANEFGTRDIPARSFMGSTADEQSAKWETSANDIINKLLIDDAFNPDRSIGILGEMMVGDIKEKIASNISPRNAQSTIARKTKGKGGKTTTLIDTGLLRNSIHFEVIEKS